jgi:hypothetical protein
MSGYILSKEQWDSMTVGDRVGSCQMAGLSGRTASKEWDGLDDVELKAVMGIQMPDYATVLIPTSIGESAYYKAQVVSNRSIANDILARILNKADNAGKESG